MEGVGRFNWQVDIPQEGVYEIVLGYAADRDGSRIEVVSKENRITDVVRKTNGYYYDSNIGPWQQNFERIALKEKIFLRAGSQTISFGLIDLIPRTVMYFRHLELIPLSAQDSIRAENDRASQTRASTDFLVDAGYGLMLHWTSQSQPKSGPHKSFAQAV